MGNGTMRARFRLKARLNGLKALALLGMAVLLLAIAAAGCGDGGGEDELLVFAATSLTDAMTEAAAAYEADGNPPVAVSYGPSQALAQQIASGAPADVFVAAGAQPMDFIIERGMAAPDAAAPLLTNRIVVVAAPGAGLESLDALAGLDRVAMADPAVAPAGRYAKAALESMGMWDALTPKLVFGNDVRSVMAYVQGGNADAAFVYQTDARIAPDLATLDIVPTDSYPAVIYPAAALADSDAQAQAAAFIAYLQGDAASAVFRKHGFTPLN